ncbi:MAG: NIPSNAP family protein [Planctomycetaceae bacterium]
MKSAVPVVAVLLLIPAVGAEDTRCFEMRTYYANPGKLDALHARFRNHTLGLFEKHGMTNVGYWVPVDNPDNKLIYILAYPSREQRDASWKAFQADEDWKAAYAESIRDGKLIAKVESVFLTATDYSPEIKAAASESPRLFELRIYTTNDGKLSDLNARFRNHTTKLFEKHGLPQFGYWTPMDEKDGRDNRLIYLLAVRDQETRDAGFKSFGQDPDWKAARTASEENGKLLINGGVQSVFLKPTDYSPTR